MEKIKTFHWSFWAVMILAIISVIMTFLSIYFEWYLALTSTIQSNVITFFCLYICWKNELESYNLRNQ